MGFLGAGIPIGVESNRERRQVKPGLALSAATADGLPFTKLMSAAGILRALDRERYDVTAIGILREHKTGREKIFLNPAFMDLLKRDCTTGSPNELMEKWEGHKLTKKEAAEISGIETVIGIGYRFRGGAGEAGKTGE